ncbi:hypothetical protein [Phreatobacter sp.]|uniref:hypothetical protein n=1 Tax=Phreatobacter sp. TaxID=1966341 RepID=UPI0022BE190B|nr:hypothetical protein [Phreatobacter sp.]MCZ8313289.1 hypothetical protein [Phreatobacter sp.]
MRPMRLVAILLLAFALAAQGLLVQTARAAQVAAMPDLTGFCLSDEKGNSHPPDRNCTVHCLLAGGGDGAAIPVREPATPVVFAPMARSMGAPAEAFRPRPTLDQAARAPPVIA